VGGVLIIILALVCDAVLVLIRRLLTPWLRGQPSRPQPIETRADVVVAGI
jgi:hypothetical protein